MSIALVQQAIGSGAAASFDVTISAPGAGNSLIALVHVLASGADVTSITGGGVTWTKAVSKVWLASSATVQIWYGHGSSGSGTTVTVNQTGTSRVGCANISEWSGLVNAGAEATNSNKGDNVDSALTTGSVTPISTNSLVIANLNFYISTYSSGPTNSFARMTAADTGASSSHLEGAYQIESSVAAYSTGMTASANCYWGTAIAAFGASPAPIAAPRNFGMRQAVNRAATY